jgi:hypothetical protein
MPERTTVKPSDNEPVAEEHLPEGENPMNVPVHQLDQSPPQPGVPERTELDQQQDHAPLHPEPVLKRVEEKGGKHRELRNG